MMKRTVLGVGFVAALVVAASASAWEDPIEARHEIMENVGGAMQVAGQMARGEMEFDPVKALLAMRTINSSIIGFVEFFPEGTETGGDTRALPAIWENMEDFVQKAAGLRSDTAAVIENPPETFEAFRSAFAEVGQNCRACHETYRRPEED